MLRNPRPSASAQSRASSLSTMRVGYCVAERPYRRIQLWRAWRPLRHLACLYGCFGKNLLVRISACAAINTCLLQPDIPGPPAHAQRERKPCGQCKACMLSEQSTGMQSTRPHGNETEAGLEGGQKSNKCVKSGRALAMASACSCAASRAESSSGFLSSES